MRIDIKIPSAGESVTEIRLARWIKSNGDFVKADEPILELETDKANMELTAETAGTLNIRVAEGTTVSPGTVVGTLNTDKTAAKPEERLTPPKEKSATSTATSLPQPQSDAGAIETGKAEEVPEKTSPAVRKLAREHNVNVEAISGTGRRGRVRKEDVLKYVEGPGAGVQGPGISPREKPFQDRTGGGPREEVVPMTLLRRKIAERMVQAQQTAAILTTFNEVDMAAVQELRAKYKDAFKEKYDVGLGFMSFFIKATIEALRSIPELNASVEGSNIIYKRYYNIGVAVSTDRGLVVPVLRDADKMSFAELEQTLGDLAKKAREGKISVDDLTGSTFTITNGGIFGSLMSTPILNPPESGILGMHAIKKRPIVVDDEVVIRPMMYLALSYDHRIVDGKEAVTFLVKVKEALEDPHRLLLGV